MEEALCVRIKRLLELRYDWKQKSWEDAVAIGPFLSEVEVQSYWEIRRSLARVTIEVRKLRDGDQIAAKLLEHIEREAADTNWGIVLVLAEEFVELEAHPAGSVATVRELVTRIHADLLRPRFAGWMPSFQRYRTWHLALSERLLSQFADT